MKTQRFALKTPKDESNLRRFASTFTKDEPIRRLADSTFAKGETIRRIQLIFNSYPGLQGLELERETTQVRGLLEDLNAEGRTADVKTLRLADYIEKLSDAQGDFDIAASRRSTEAQILNLEKVIAVEKAANSRARKAPAKKE